MIPLPKVLFMCSSQAFLPKGAFEAAMAGELSSKASKGGLAKEGIAVRGGNLAS
jgi:hypothetical protein